MKILFAGGGSGGHIFPIIAIAREIKKTHPKADIIYMGPEDELSSKTFFKEGIKTCFIFSGKIRRYFNPISFLENIFDVLIKIPLGIIQAFLILFFIAPDLIFCKGGYGSLPAAIAGSLLGIPIVLHESDVAPGLANRILSRFSKIIFVSFPAKQTSDFPFAKMIEMGNPIRPGLLDIEPNFAKNELRISSNKPVLLVLGGSQGSARINNLLIQILPKVLNEFEIIHQTGYNDFERIRSEFLACIPNDLQSSYHIYPFLTEIQIKSAMSLAACIVGRAGAGTIFEIAAFHKPSILIPLSESAQNHQTKNAYAYAKSGAAIVLEEKNCTPAFFSEKVFDLITFGNLELMAKAAAEFGKPQAASNIAKFITDFLDKK